MTISEQTVARIGRLMKSVAEHLLAASRAPASPGRLAAPPHGRAVADLLDAGDDDLVAGLQAADHE